VDAEAGEVEPVGVPACADGRVVAGLPAVVVDECGAECLPLPQVEVQREPVCEVGGACSVFGVVAVVQPLRVMECREDLHDADVDEPRGRWRVSAAVSKTRQALDG
jgi:hypothetical protein